MECTTPFTKRTKTGNVSMGTIQTKAVPCGKCPACRKKRTTSWMFRLQEEEKKSLSSDFITLTYGTSTLDFTENGYPTLNKVHVQLFFKALRKLCPAKLKYFACGEYGTQNNRPHYHIILFNANNPTAIQQAWLYGAVHYGQVTPASVTYTLKYMTKNAKVPETGGIYTGDAYDDRQKEFALMSKGLGESYLTPAMIRWHMSDEYQRNYVNLPDNKKLSMPRYYKDKIYKDEAHRKALAIKARVKAEHSQDKKTANDPMYHRNKFEAHKQQFFKQAKETAKKNTL